MSPPDSAPPSAPVSAAAPRRRRGWAVAGGVVGLVVAVLVAWWTLRNEGQRITATTIGYRVESNTTVTVSFDKPTERRVRPLKFQTQVKRSVQQRCLRAEFLAAKRCCQCIQ